LRADVVKDSVLGIVLVGLLALSNAQAAVNSPPAPCSGVPKPPANSGTQIHILKLTDTADRASGLALALNNNLLVVLDAKGPVDPTCYALFLNGIQISGLDDTIYDSKRHALNFHLDRNAKNATAWTALLGAPTTLTRQVSVALGEVPAGSERTSPTIVGLDAKQPTFTLVMLSPVRLALAAFAILLVTGLVWGGAKRSTLLKDNLVPQIDPKRQPYSLGRWQMAFWFTLIFASYVFLYILLWDQNTLSEQALMLMGISSATAFGAVTVDVMKDSPADAVNAALRALGIKNFDDVIKLRMDLESWLQQAASTNPAPTAETLAQLQAKIVDQQLLLQTYDDAIKPYVSDGWFADITTDLNGTALHRLQVFCWTLLLGVIFLFDVWSTLTMPQFSGTLLALMAISGTGYVGFKYSANQV